MPGGIPPSTMTTAQLQALKADIAANSNTVLINGVATAISAVPVSPDNGIQVAAWYNLPTAAFNVFRSNVPIAEITNQVVWANYTPAPAPDTSVQWSNCSLACQGKQFNLQLLLPPGSVFNAGLVNLRAGLNDATTNLPSGTPLGTTKTGGWSAILPILRRLASNIEKLFAVATTGVGTTGTDALGATTNPGLLVFDSSVAPLTGNDVLNAWNS